MKKELLNLIPKRFLCPYCGEWHEWRRRELGYYDSSSYQVDFKCSNAPSGCNKGNYKIYFYGDCLYYSTERMCQRANQYMNGKIPISSILEDPDKPIVTFDVAFTSNSDVGWYECSDCDYKSKCNCLRLGDEGDGRHMIITFGFEFASKDFNKYREKTIMAETTNKRTIVAETTKEETIVAETTNKQTSLKTQIFEKSPKENIELVKAWAERYKPVLRWGIPVAAVYGAYRILNSQELDLSVNNISKTCEEKLGFKLELLENKRALKELMVLGGISAGAYGALKAISNIFGTQEEKDISVEEVETGMNQLESVSKKFAWIQPKTEAMLPIAFSVIMVYMSLHKPKLIDKFANMVHVLTEDIKIKFDTYISLIQLFIEDKFNMDLSNEEERNKLKICAFLVALIGIFVFLYGKKVLEDKNTSEEKGEDKKKIGKSVETFVEQAKAIIKENAPTIYTTLITFLVSKKLMSHGEPLKMVEGEGNPTETDTNSETQLLVVPGTPEEEPVAPTENHSKE